MRSLFQSLEPKQQNRDLKPITECAGSTCMREKDLEQ